MGEFFTAIWAALFPPVVIFGAKFYVGDQVKTSKAKADGYLTGTVTEVRLFQGRIVYMINEIVSHGVGRTSHADGYEMGVMRYQEEIELLAPVNA